jgi:hypothetical protein
MQGKLQIILGEIGYEGGLIDKRLERQAVVNTVMKFRVPYKAKFF